MHRRQFLRSALMGLGGAPFAAATATGALPASNPFTLGIASGDITDRTVVLWTRLAPDPVNPERGMPNGGVVVQWELSENSRMTRVFRRGQSVASPTLAHSVHVELDDLEPNRQYWYQFRCGRYKSAIGRTRTLPGPLDSPEELRFVTASCQNYCHGHFVAYRHMVRDDPDFVIHLGDYIYDTSFGETFRQHPSQDPPRTLGEFRRWHALYKTDPFLQQAHAAAPFFASIDNHDAIEDRDPGQSAIRAAAYQAWYEHMPVRGYSTPGANSFDIHRRIAVGDLAQICMLDSRQFRDKRGPCSGDYDRDYGFGNYRERCAEVFAEHRSMLGATQEQWLIDSLKDNRAAWSVIASPGPFLPFSYQVGKKDLRYIGAWDAYPANRQRIAEALAQSQHGLPLLLSGDVHSFWAVDGSRGAASSERFPLIEFVTSSISANWPPALAQPVTDNLGNNPQVTFYDPQHRGYLLHEVSPREWQTTARGVDDVQDANADVRNIARFTVDRHYQLRKTHTQ